MAQRFQDEHVDREGRLSLGVDVQTGTRFLSIPVGNAMADYEEYYRLSDDEYARFLANPAEARTFADACRERLHDDRLILKPGSDRGVPR